MSLARLKKFAALLTRPGLYGALRHGVAPAIEHDDAIRHVMPKTLLDVGANKGQFSALARYFAPDVRIIAFEPLESERAKFSVVVPNARILPVAIGDNPGKAQFHLTNRPDSSSLFAPSSDTKSAYGVSTVQMIEVDVARLRDVVTLDQLQSPVMMKIDVQGAEMSVLRSIGPDIGQIDFIYCEVSFVRLYEGQPMVSEVIAYLYEQGFELRGVYNISHTALAGLTQADILFERAMPAPPAH